MRQGYSVITKNSYDLNGHALFVDGQQIPYHLSRNAVERILFHNFRHLLLELHTFRQRRIYRKQILKQAPIDNSPFTKGFYDEWKTTTWADLHEQFTKISSKFRELREDR